MALRRTDIPTIRRPRYCRAGLRAALAGLALAGLAALASSAGGAASDAVVAQLLTRDLIGVPGKEVTMETVEYAPAAKSPPHRHHAQVFVYVLEGSVRMQVQGSATVTLGPGGTFYESPDDLHTVSENASQTKSAKFLVVMLKDKAPAASAEGQKSGQGRAEAAGQPLPGLSGPDIVRQQVGGTGFD
jgi:quercetin dioxygenase-like cupin family protein